MAEYFGSDLILLERLAAGGMAEVYRAKKVGRGGFEKTVAVKRILPHYAGNDDFKKMFEAEAGLSARLQHPNIVQVFSYGEHDGYLYIEMEFVDGKDTRKLLSRAEKLKEKLPVEITCAIIAEVAKGLEYAHSLQDEKNHKDLNIVHRDISPQNIMLSYNGHVKLVDFGIAKAANAGESTRAGVLKGKFGYMSPEQATGSQVDKRTDIFALGVVLFEMLTQKRLFATDDEFKTLQLVKECNVPRPSKYNPSVDTTLDNIVLKALKKEKSERYATAGDLARALSQFLSQRYPEFVITDLDKYFKKIFDNDIVEERKKREKINAEIPLRPAQGAPKPSSLPRNSDSESSPQDRTPVPNLMLGSVNVNDVTVIDGGAANQQPNAKMIRLQPNEAPSAMTSTGQLPPQPRASNSTSVSPAPMPSQIRVAPGQITQIRQAPKRNNLMPMVVGLALFAGIFAFQDELVKMYEQSFDQKLLRVPANNTDANAEQKKSTMSLIDDATTSLTGPLKDDSGDVQNTATTQPVSGVAETPVVQEAKPADRKPSSKPILLGDYKGALGSLNISSTPEANEVYVNGVLLTDDEGNALRTPLKYALPPGRYKVVLKNLSYGQRGQSTRDNVVIQKNIATPLELILGD